MKVARATLYTLVILVAALLLAAQFGLLAGKAPTDLGVTDGRLKPPSNTPNSVSSQAHLYPDHPQKDYAQIDPLPLKGGGDVQASMRAIVETLQALPGVTVVQQQPDYLYVQSQTRWMKYIDDLEFWVNPSKGVIELRSASRLGHGDLNLNRQRMETIRNAYLAKHSSAAEQ